MKLLANENFPLTSVKLLRKAGFDIQSISEQNCGISDKEVIDMAITENSLILTFDRDYGELIFKHNYKPQAGIIYFRWEFFEPHSVGEFCVKLFTNNDIDFANTLTVIDEKGVIRQKKY